MWMSKTHLEGEPTIHGRQRERGKLVGEGRGEGKRKGRIEYGERQEGYPQGQENELTYAAVAVRRQGKSLGSPRDLGCERLPGLNGDDISQISQQ